MDILVHTYTITNSDKIKVIQAHVTVFLDQVKALIPQSSIIERCLFHWCHGVSLNVMVSMSPSCCENHYCGVILQVTMVSHCRVLWCHDSRSADNLTVTAQCYGVFTTELMTPVSRADDTSVTSWWHQCHSDISGVNKLIISASLKQVPFSMKSITFILIVAFLLVMWLWQLCSVIVSQSLSSCISWHHYLWWQHQTSALCHEITQSRVTLLRNCLTM